MSDRAAWLEQWCSACRAAPGARCSRSRPGRGAAAQTAPNPQLHVARGWLERPCPTCKAPAGERCSTPSGRDASRPHAARLRPARHELLWGPAVWVELERRGATIAIVPFSGRQRSGGRTESITLLRLQELVVAERWTSRDELCYALEAPIWDRFGTFAGQPHVQGEVVWRVSERRVLIRGKRGEHSFEELAA